MTTSEAAAILLLHKCMKAHLGYGILALLDQFNSAEALEAKLGVFEPLIVTEQARH